MTPKGGQSDVLGVDSTLYEINRLKLRKLNKRTE